MTKASATAPDAARARTQELGEALHDGKHRWVPARLAKFGLELATEKSALVKFNRWEGESSGKFTFLGFDFFWGRSRHNPNYWRVRRVTNAKKFRNGLKALKSWLKRSRSLPLPEIIATLKSKLRGVWNY